MIDILQGVIGFEVIMHDHAGHQSLGDIPSFFRHTVMRQARRRSDMQPFRSSADPKTRLIKMTHSGLADQ